jgi:hypothetical protein
MAGEDRKIELPIDMIGERFRLSDVEVDALLYQL